jgi:hypothetical protein
MPPGLVPPLGERRRVPPRDGAAPAGRTPDRRVSDRPAGAGAWADEPWENRTVEPRPVSARPVDARAVQGRPVQSRPVAPPPAAPAAPPYGDWTKPSRSGADAAIDTDTDTGTGTGVAVVDEPVTGGRTGEQAREQAAGRSSRAAELFPRLQASAAAANAVERAPASDEHPAAMTGTIGGRAALREKRRADEEARKKAGKGSTASGRGGGGGGGAGGGRRSPRWAATGLVAVAVVALGVLGVYSFASPHTRSTASAAAAPNSVPVTAPATNLSDLPPLATGAVAPSVAPAPSAAAAHLPVTVLNETSITGLAARVSGAVKAGGWPVTDVGTYTPKDIATTTVYFTQGDDAQRAAAVALVDQFPQVHGPVPRFFDVPGQPTPGLVVVTTGDWKP